MKDTEARNQIEELRNEVKYVDVRHDILNEKFAALLDWIGVYTVYNTGVMTIKEYHTKELVDEAIENTREFRRKHR